jgi:hypothetical protein
MMEHPDRKGKACNMHGMSRIRNDTKGRDADSDFCNLFNVMRTTGKNFTEIHPIDCREMPKREEMMKTCMKVYKEDLGLAMTPN